MSEVEVKDVTGVEEVEKPEQLHLDFKRQYSDIRLKEAVRGVKAITKELIRFGLSEKMVSGLMETISIWNPIILAAADAIDEAIPD